MINRPKIWKLSLIALAVMLTVSCTKIDYVGKSYAPTVTIDVYFSLEDIKGNYEVMGHLTATAGEFTSSEKMQEKIIEKAREKGADAVVILGLDHYIKDGGTSWSETTETEHTDDGKKTTTTGSQSSNTEEMKEISARFIKYKEHGE
jgi:hypothetical protein